MRNRKFRDSISSSSDSPVAARLPRCERIWKRLGRTSVFRSHDGTSDGRSPLHIPCRFSTLVLSCLIFVVFTEQMGMSSVLGILEGVHARNTHGSGSFPSLRCMVGRFTVLCKVWCEDWWRREDVAEG